MRLKRPAIELDATRPSQSSSEAGAPDLLLRRASLPRVRFHDLRYTAPRVMLSRGVHPKIVAERLGHSTPILTLTVYSHITPTMQRGAADELDTLLSSGG